MKYFRGSKCKDLFRIDKALPCFPIIKLSVEKEREKSAFLNFVKAFQI